eukprot:01831_4
MSSTAATLWNLLSAKASGSNQRSSLTGTRPRFSGSIPTRRKSNCACPLSLLQNFDSCIAPTIHQHTHTLSS